MDDHPSDETIDQLNERLSDRIAETCDVGTEGRAEELASLQRIIDSEVVESERERASALSSETRYKLVRALVAANRELCVCELNAMFDVSDSAVSHGLSRLADAGLVTYRSDGRWRMYRATNLAVSLVTVLGAETTIDMDAERDRDAEIARVDGGCGDC